MKKLILAIATVFCLQLGLVLYTAFEDGSLGGEAKMAAVDEPPEPALEPPAEALFGNAAGAARSGQPDALRSATPRRRRNSARIDRSQSSSIDDKPRVILYSRKGALTAFNRAPLTPAEALTGQPATAQVVARRGERRSFLTRAQPVIRKPYDWLKALASRLR